MFFAVRRPSNPCCTSSGGVRLLLVQTSIRVVSVCAVVQCLPVSLVNQSKGCQKSIASLPETHQWCKTEPSGTCTTSLMWVFYVERVTIYDYVYTVYREQS
ncbi:unnamed protein product [Larinioides sclopetarius]|uniref:Uncharacterized protein n=1 Tax=Larinioides sclopetarius TaxID=280406 RepID=A0AAV1ZQJ2_9ARAC